ncbi:MAG: hypothetical protein HRU20_24745 [Pseudomonadales bacterium]|nr:hypothetical protein [Pseudomonadales bacterium]
MSIKEIQADRIERAGFTLTCTDCKRSNTADIIIDSSSEAIGPQVTIKCRGCGKLNPTPL